MTKQTKLRSILKFLAIKSDGRLGSPMAREALDDTETQIKALHTIDQKEIEKEIIKATVKKDYPCITCGRRYIKNAKMTKTKGTLHQIVGGKIDCLCEKVEIWNENLAKSITKYINTREQ